MAIENYDKIAFENDLFYTRDTTNYRVAGTQTASTNVWVGALPEGLDNYYDGLTIDYYLPFAGNSNGATLELGNKGAKPVYLDASTRVTNQIKAKSVIRLSYHSTVVSGGAWLLIGGAGDNELPTASADTKGGIKLGYSQSGKNYPVQLDNEKAYVYVPWEGGSSSGGTVTQVSTGAGLTGGPITESGTIKADLTDETKLADVSLSPTYNAHRVYPIRLDKNGKLAVVVPWVDTWYNAEFSTNISTEGHGRVFFGDQLNHDYYDLVPGANITIDKPANRQLRIASTDHDTWKANSNESEGYVSSASGQVNKVWKTDAEGNPAWRDDANTWNENLANQAGYVASPANTSGVSWKTDNEGNPTWINEYHFQLSTTDDLYEVIGVAGWSDCIVED